MVVACRLFPRLACSVTDRHPLNRHVTLRACKKNKSSLNPLSSHTQADFSVIARRGARGAGKYDGEFHHLRRNLITMEMSPFSTSGQKKCFLAGLQSRTAAAGRWPGCFAFKTRFWLSGQWKQTALSECPSALEISRRQKAPAWRLFPALPPTSERDPALHQTAARREETAYERLCRVL